jgi:membrane protease YdiL (CAAX protease family)
MEKSRINFHRVLIFSFCLISYSIFLLLPSFYNNLRFIHGSWNWNGKLYASIWAIICYYLFRRFFIENDFFSIKQERKNIKITLIVSMIAVFITSIYSFLFADKLEFDIETLLFQLTMPGIDEEILFRCILLGILISCLKEKLFFSNKHLAILLVSILFCNGHSLFLDSSYSLSFSIEDFIITGLMSYVLGWISVKSKSIFIPILVHNISNFLWDLIGMIK